MSGMPGWPAPGSSGAWPQSAAAGTTASSMKGLCPGAVRSSVSMGGAAGVGVVAMLALFMMLAMSSDRSVPFVSTDDCGTSGLPIDTAGLSPMRRRLTTPGAADGPGWGPRCIWAGRFSWLMASTCGCRKLWGGRALSVCRRSRPCAQGGKRPRMSGARWDESGWQEERRRSGTGAAQ